jgi:glutamyl-tRNA reductase
LKNSKVHPSVQQAGHQLILGLSFRTAQAEIRDKAVLQGDARDLLCDLARLPGIRECAFVSTCNRVEFYISTTCPQPLDVLPHLAQWWAGRSTLSTDEVLRYSYRYTHGDAVEHLLRVASSLDSLLIGEGQILGQIRAAYALASECGTAGMYLHHLFQHALAFGKNVRTHTGIGQGAVSISSAAVQMCRKVFGDLKDAKALVLGAGEMARLASVHFREVGLQDLVICNRTESKARLLAERQHAKTLAWEERYGALAEVDVLISCTSAPGFVLEAAMAKSLLKKRRGKPLVMVDIAVPRDLDPQVEHVADGVYLFSVDDLQKVMEEGQNSRQQAAKTVEAMLVDSLESYVEWYRSLDVVPAITQLRSYTERILLDEIAHLPDSPSKSETERALRHFAARLMHNPSRALRSLGEEGLAHEASWYIERLVAPQEDSRHDN